MATVEPITAVEASDRRALAGLRSEYFRFVGGQWVEAAPGERMEIVDPSTEGLLALVPAAGAEEVDRAVRGARSAQGAWAATGWQHRSEVLWEMAARVEAHAAELAAIDAVDGGIPVAGIRKDVGNSIGYLRYFGGVASELKGQTIEAPGGSMNLTAREPWGVVGRIVPFNHPLQFCVAGIAGPLAAGNAVVLKPSGHTPLSALRFAELVADLVPPGVLSILSGGAGAGSAIVRHPEVPRIAFTGSVGSGRARATGRGRAHQGGHPGAGRQEPHDRLSRRRPGQGGQGRSRGDEPTAGPGPVVRLALAHPGACQHPARAGRRHHRAPLGIPRRRPARRDHGHGAFGLPGPLRARLRLRGGRVA